jgi:hypothetical protein
MNFFGHSKLLYFIHISFLHVLKSIWMIREPFKMWVKSEMGRRESILDQIFWIGFQHHSLDCSFLWFHTIIVHLNDFFRGSNSFVEILQTNFQ